MMIIMIMINFQASSSYMIIISLSTHANFGFKIKFNFHLIHQSVFMIQLTQSVTHVATPTRPLNIDWLWPRR